MGMTEALTLGNQSIGAGTALLWKPRAIGHYLACVAAAGQVARNLPAFVAQALASNDATRTAISKIVAGNHHGLVGMSRVEHVHVNAKLVGVALGYGGSVHATFTRGEGRRRNNLMAPVSYSDGLIDLIQFLQK
jgi:hypothetical protein